MQLTSYTCTYQQIMFLEKDSVQKTTDPSSGVINAPLIIIRRTFIKRHKSGNIHSEVLYMSMYTCVVEL